MASKRLVILGTGGNCLDILDTVRAINGRASTPAYECIGFLDDDPSKHGTKIDGCPVLGPLPDARQFPDAHFINGIGSTKNFWQKPEIIARTGLDEGRFETLIHPSACVAPSVVLGPGIAVLQNVTIASRVSIGAHVILLPGSVISHDCVVGDYTCVATGACISGHVVVGRCCYLGSNSSILERLRIGEECLVGMGAVVLRDIPEGTVVVGNPARPLRRTRLS